jgi:hypothetical protein
VVVVVVVASGRVVVVVDTTPLFAATPMRYLIVVPGATWSPTVDVRDPTTLCEATLPT